MTTRNRSRQAETEDINPRRLKRGAIKRVHVAPWAIGRDELAPGVVGDTHLGPRSVNETHIHPTTAAALSGGLTTTLTRSGAQTIAVGGSAIEFTEVDAGPRRHGITVTPPTPDVVMPGGRVVSVVLRFRWSDWKAGGTVRLLRDGVVVDSSPASWGPRFEGTLHAGLVNEGETLSVAVDHQDASTHDVEDVRAAFKVEGAVGSGSRSWTDEVGIYTVNVLEGLGLTLNRLTASGEDQLAATSFSVVNGVWYHLRARATGSLLQAKAWATTDPEPAGWLLSHSDPDRLSIGYVGVAAGTAGTGHRDYDAIEVSNDGAAAVTSDFSEHPSGVGVPAGWERIFRTSTNWSIVDDAGATGGKLLRHTSDGVGSIIAWTEGGVGGDMDVKVRGRVDAGVGLSVAFSGNSLL